MRFQSRFSRTFVGAALVVLMSFGPAFAGVLADYKFKVHNNTRVAIKQILVSENGKKWGSFDIGRRGIAPGATMELVWDESTDNDGCEWYFKAVWADGDESDASAFDFCEKDLVIEFTK